MVCCVVFSLCACLSVRTKNFEPNNLRRVHFDSVWVKVIGQGSRSDEEIGYFFSIKCVDARHQVTYTFIFARRQHQKSTCTAHSLSSSSSSSLCGLKLNGRCCFHVRLPCRRLTHGKHFSRDVPSSSPGKRGQVGWPKT